MPLSKILTCILSNVAIFLLLGCASTFGSVNSLKAVNQNTDQFSVDNYDNRIDNAIENTPEYLYSKDLVTDPKSNYNSASSMVITTDSTAPSKRTSINRDANLHISALTVESEAIGVALLMAGNMYFNQGAYPEAADIYQSLAYKYHDPKIVYAALIALNHTTVSEAQINAINNLAKRLILLDPNSSVAKLFEIKTSLYNGNQVKAEKDLDAIMRKDSEKARAILLFLSGTLTNDLGFNLPAITSSPKVLDALNNFANYIGGAYKNIPETYLLMTVSYSITNNIDGLNKTTNYIAKHYPTWHIPFYWMVDVLSIGGHVDTISKILGNVIALEGSNDQILRNIYIVSLINTNQNDTAKHYLLSIINPSTISEAKSAKLWLAKSNNKLADDELIDSSVAKDFAYLDLGIIAIKEGDFNNAIKYLQQVNPSDSALNNLSQLLAGLIYDVLGDKNKAENVYLKVKTNGDVATLRNALLISLYASQKDTVKLNNIIEQTTNNISATGVHKIMYQAGLYSDIGDYAKSYSLLNSYEQRYISNQAFLYQYASSAALAGKTSKAISLYKKYIDKNPDSSDGYNDLAYVYADQTHEYKLALKYALIAYAKSPQDPNVLDTLGWCYYKLNNYPKAFDLLSKSYSLSQDPSIAKHYKQILLSRGDVIGADKIIVTSHSSMDDSYKGQILAKIILEIMYMQYGLDINLK